MASIAELFAELNMIVPVVEDFKNTLTELKIEVPAKDFFRQCANIIYNYNLPEGVDPVKIAPDEIYPSDIVKKTKYIYDTKVYISMALKARGINTDELSFDEYPASIVTITEDNYMEILSLTSEAGTEVGDTKITVNDFDSGSFYYYKIGVTTVPLKGEDLSDEWVYFDPRSEDITATSGVFIGIIELKDNKVNRVGLIKAISKKEEVIIFNISSIKGFNGWGTFITPDNEKSEDHDYYYSEIDGDPHYERGDNISIRSKNYWDGESEIVFSTLAETTKLHILVDVMYDDNNVPKVYSYGLFTPVVKERPQWYNPMTVSSVAGTEDGFMMITTSSPKLSYSDYYYIFTNEDIDLQYDDFNSEGFTYWNGKSEIEAVQGSRFLLVEVDPRNNDVLRSGYGYATVYKGTLKLINFYTIPGTEIMSTELKIISEPSREDPIYYYKITDEVDLPEFKSQIDDSYILYQEEELIGLNEGDKILLVEVNDTDNILQAGFGTVKIKKGKLSPIILHVEKGSSYNKTIITIRSEQHDPDSVYYYTPNAVVVNYGDNIEGWIPYTDPELTGYPNRTIITMVEAVDGKIIAVGSCSVDNG